MPMHRCLSLPPLTRQLATVGLLLAATGGACANPTVPDAGQLLNQQQRANTPLVAPRPEPGPALSSADEARTSEPAAPGLQARVQQIRFTGATHLVPGDELQTLLAPALNRDLNHTQLQLLAQQVTQRLRERGYVVARAYLPPQDLSDGTLTIGLLDGRLQAGEARITLKADTRVAPAHLRAIAEAALPAGDPLRQHDLERAVLLMNDLPGVSARAVLERGDEVGTSKLVVTATQAPLVQWSLSADNFGSRSTGAERMTGQVRLLDPSGRGDSLTMSTTLSSGTRAVAAAYRTPLQPNGLQATVSATHLRYEVGGALQPLALEGQASTVAAGVSYPMVRTRERNLTLQAALERKQLQDDALGTTIRERRLTNLTLGLAGDAADNWLGGGVTSGSANLTSGAVNLGGHAPNKLADANSARTHGSFDKFTFNVNRFQNLGISEDWIAFLGLSGQLTADNLDSAEKFILGGPNGVRAYPVGEAAGDMGLLATLELRRKLSLPWVEQAQLLLFVDMGAIQLHTDAWTGAINNATGRNRYTLQGWGVGLNLVKNAWSVQSAVAARLGKNAGRALDGSDSDGRDSDVRAWLQASRRFD